MNQSIQQVLANIHEKLNINRVDDAVLLCRQAIKRYPKQVEPCVLLAQIESQRGQYELAINALKKASKRKPQEVAFHLMQGELYTQLEQINKAEKAYNSALLLSPEDDMLKTRLASVLQLQNDKIDKAIELYKSVVENQSNNPDAHYNLGTAYKCKHEFSDAILSYKTAVSLSPSDVELRIKLGNLLFEVGRFEEAAVELSMSSELQPENPDLLYQLSYVNKRLQRPYEALICAEKLALLTHNSPKALSVLVAAKIMNAEYESALVDCDLGLSKKPKDRRLLSDKTIALSGKGDKQSARGLFKLDELLKIDCMDVPDGYDSISEFNNNLIMQIESNKKLSFSGVSHSCQKGSTSNDVVFDSPVGSLKVLHDFIYESALAYYDELNKLSSHPWMKNIPEFEKLSVSGWVTKLNNHGHQHGHIHDTAWISGVYYVNLPTNQNDQAGAIEFGRAPFFYPDGDQGCIRVVEPKGGTLVLFPSYFYHRTIPFESEADRVTIAFDFRTSDFL